MWVFTTDGMFSVVAHEDKAGYVLVRCRAEADLDALLGWIGDGLGKQHTPEADYPWRTVLPAGMWAAYVEDAARAIDYVNFKDAIHEADPERARTYTKVWWVLHDLEEESRLHT